ncbi:hypothetical protein Salat_0875200 [Sesamum alatum]|uniref:Uncharacterized protein n=1 Tax=Sesamum alatum TaxID=300844 RepID=A0AAE1YJW4_9LAMI|nr:hypothetical protein Salat_0875200 [Sesamum alatum]
MALSLRNPNGGGGDGMAAETTGGTDQEDGERIANEFRFDDFMKLAERVMGEGDVESLIALKKLQQKWTMKYGGDTVTRPTSSNMEGPQPGELVPLPVPKPMMAHNDKGRSAYSDEEPKKVVPERTYPAAYSCAAFGQ